MTEEKVEKRQKKRWKRCRRKSGKQTEQVGLGESRPGGRRGRTKKEEVSETCKARRRKKQSAE